MCNMGAGLAGLLVLSILSVVWGALPDTTLAPSSASPTPARLSFSVEGGFRIMQLTDIHYPAGLIRTLYSPLLADDNTGSTLSSYFALNMHPTTHQIRKMVTEYNPDVIAITGDTVSWAAATFSKSAITHHLALAAVLDDIGVPWFITLGNHDSDQAPAALVAEEEREDGDLPIRQDIMAALVDREEREGKGLFLGSVGSVATEAEGYGSDYVLSVYDDTAVSDDGAKGTASPPSVLLWALDSHREDCEETDSKYGCVEGVQAEWVADTYTDIASASATGDIPGLAFFHIPTEEFGLGIDTDTIGEGYQSPSDLDGGVYIGDKGEDTCDSGVQNGIIDMLSQAVHGNLWACFCGHDHVNNYCTVSEDSASDGDEVHSSLLCYGQKTGYTSYWSNDHGSGARIIDLALDTQTPRSLSSVTTFVTGRSAFSQALGERYRVALETGNSTPDASTQAVVQRSVPAGSASSIVTLPSQSVAELVTYLPSTGLSLSSAWDWVYPTVYWCLFLRALLTVAGCLLFTLYMMCRLLWCLCTDAIKAVRGRPKVTLPLSLALSMHSGGQTCGKGECTQVLDTQCEGGEAGIGSVGSSEREVNDEGEREKEVTAQGEGTGVEATDAALDGSMGMSTPEPSTRESVVGASSMSETCSPRPVGGQTDV
ncbi:hypothetical protein KIPB_004223 [Kipferlia bialata]|uniref:Calcineurin-like phosphoesterase domain-containing protein n=1 Tax=Kipferlia bialata TaxID=797122 RepID=A0A9K3CUR0_9EUKA|nr:hypothetical protein KIPB_004223 [Kipferlia bialata]|eukprot:g4223.t1